VTTRKKHTYINSLQILELVSVQWFSAMLYFVIETYKTLNLTIFKSFCKVVYRSIYAII